MFVSAGGLNVLVEFLDEDYDEARDLVLIGVNGIWNVFQLQVIIQLLLDGHQKTNETSGANTKERFLSYLLKEQNLIASCPSLGPRA